ncbi:hypothetical protein KEM48_007712 [Puccinia striiformis f. sp. tritici PST-130]|nr:hypothetical protein KEM48_007712 [Puccinia striiformis f. sp. tritici PST-130]
MQQSGVRRFAPNFLEPPNAPDNDFLWNVAVDIFVELVECGGYADLDENFQDRVIIASEMRKYVRETLARRYKKENLWPEDKQTKHTSTQKRKGCRSHLVDSRCGAYLCAQIQKFLFFI